MRLRVRKGRGRLAAGLGALLIVAGAVGAWTATRSAGTSTSAPTTVAATTGTIRQSVTASGTIEPAATEPHLQPRRLRRGHRGVRRRQARSREGRRGWRGSSSASLVSQVAQAKAALAPRPGPPGLPPDGRSLVGPQLAADRGRDRGRRERRSPTRRRRWRGATLTSPIAGTVTAVNVHGRRQQTSRLGVERRRHGSGSGGGARAPQARPPRRRLVLVRGQSRSSSHRVVRRRRHRRRDRRGLRREG